MPPGYSHTLTYGKFLVTFRENIACPALKRGGILQISEVLLLTPKGRKLEGEGVVPYRMVLPTISNLQQKRDPVVAEAEKVLREMSSLPGQNEH